MQPFLLGPPLVWVDTYEFDYEKINPVIQETFEIAGGRNTNAVFLEQGDAASTAKLCTELPHKQPHLREENKEFLHWMHIRLRSIMKYWDYPQNAPYFIYNSWYNSHFRGGETLEHNHALTHIVASCYIKVPEDSGNIIFRDPLHDIRSMEPHQHGSNPWIDMKVKTGDVVFFPGWLYHRVQPSNSDEERIVMTINIKIDEMHMNWGYLAAMRNGSFVSSSTVLE